MADNRSMGPAVRMFKSFDEADRADREYYRNLTPEQRLDIFLALLDQPYPGRNRAQERLERVYRVVKREPR